MAPHLIPEGHRIEMPGSRARYCPVSIQPRAQRQAGIGAREQAGQEKAWRGVRGALPFPGMCKLAGAPISCY